MLSDRQLSRNFWLSEFPGWERATEADVSLIAETVARVLQPIRAHFGVPVRVGSWMYWRNGAARTGSHSHAGTVDFTVDDGRTREAFEWASRALVPAGYIGRLIYEPARTAREGVEQREHVHMAPRAAMTLVFGDPDIQVLEESAEGEYSYFREAVSWGAAAALGGLLYFLARWRAPATH